MGFVYDEAGFLLRLSGCSFHGEHHRFRKKRHQKPKQIQGHISCAFLKQDSQEHTFRMNHHWRTQHFMHIYKEEMQRFNMFKVQGVIIVPFI